ncbi:GDSL-type esterase/lipase family protein [Nostoc sp. NIES-2111]
MRVPIHAASSYFRTCLTGLLTALLACLTLNQAQGQTNITFRVDPGRTIANPVLYVTGSFNNWALTQRLTRDTDGLYSATVPVTAGVGTVVQYKFVNGAWSRQERLSGCSYGTSSNRYFRMPAADTVLGNVCFNQCSRCDSVRVTLDVTLTEPPSAQGVHVAGTFQGWVAATTPMTAVSANTYRFQRFFAKGSFLEYKFLNGADWSAAETVTGPCSYNPQNQPNRYLLVPERDTLISVSFGSCTGEPVPYPSPRIAFVGSSSTYGFGALRPAYMSYPAQFAHLWAAAGKSGYVSDFGRNSTTMAKVVSGPISYWTSPDLPLALAYQPDLLVINLGSNDVKSALFQTRIYKRDYNAMIDTFRVFAPNVEILASSPIRTGLATEPLVRDSLLQAQVDVAVERGLGFIDIHEATMPGSGFLLNADSTHADSAGYAIVARRVYEVLSQARPTVTIYPDSLAAPSGYAGYQWYRNDTLMPGQTRRTLQVDTGFFARYKVVVRLHSDNNNRLASAAVQVGHVTALKSYLGADLQVFPNPAQTLLSLNGLPAQAQIQILDATGRSMNMKAESPTRFDISTLVQGIYTIRITVGAEVVTRRFAKQ